MSTGELTCWSSSLLQPLCVSPLQTLFYIWGWNLTAAHEFDVYLRPITFGEVMEKQISWHHETSLERYFWFFSLKLNEFFPFLGIVGPFLFAPDFSRLIGNVQHIKLDFTRVQVQVLENQSQMSLALHEDKAQVGYWGILMGKCVCFCSLDVFLIPTFEEGFTLPRDQFGRKILARSGVSGRLFSSGASAETVGHRKGWHTIPGLLNALSGSGELIPKDPCAHHSHPSFPNRRRQMPDTIKSIIYEQRLVATEKPAALKPSFWSMGSWLNNNGRWGGGKMRWKWWIETAVF